MRRVLVNHIFLTCFVVLLLQLCAPSLSFYHDTLPDIELTEHSEQDKETNEKERLKTAEELTDKVPGSIDICFLPGDLRPNKFNALAPLQDAYPDVPVPPPDKLMA